MGFTLAEAQWLVKFYRNLPGQAPPGPSGMGDEEAEYMRAMEMQAAQAAQAYGDYSNYPSEEYFDEYW